MGLSKRFYESIFCENITIEAQQIMQQFNEITLAKEDDRLHNDSK